MKMKENGKGKREGKGRQNDFRAPQAALCANAPLRFHIKYVFGMMHARP